MIRLQRGHGCRLCLRELAVAISIPVGHTDALHLVISKLDSFRFYGSVFPDEAELAPLGVGGVCIEGACRNKKVHLCHLVAKTT